MRIVDRRSDPTIHARLNTRPPAAQPYKNIGAGMKPAIVDATLKEQQMMQHKLIEAHLAKQKPAGAARGNTLTPTASLGQKAAPADREVSER